jgi:Tol biopolymer transport system component
MIWKQETNSLKNLPILHSDFRDWSGDEKKILVRRRETGTRTFFQLFSIDIESNTIQKVTTKLEGISSAFWGKNSNLVYYTVGKDLFLIDLANSKTRKIAKNIATLNISRDRSKIAYLNDRDHQLYIINWDGTPVAKLAF